ncbi:MAG: ABC transporter ATP-binding protein [Spirulinaceae cyanobacterium RM2_2_10]|nr:ABC transporter ATP-binding protein [Spirulinaceae cyanobacterium SM2_1_0]NJO20849.1 ABC transporter ATP-binding protein [Spirulinaceae cyanobacterium RM2_2_10]
MSAVELVNLSKVFVGQDRREVRAIDAVNLQIVEGEFFSLLGPSGCGKTTILRMIAGFESPTAGEVRIGGEPMRDRPPFHRPVNTVFQNYALFPHLTVMENVSFGLEMDGVPRSQRRDRVAQALELVKLNGFEDRRPRQLSGGQQQRVALARALVKQPRVLLFDEPLGALDLKLRKTMQLELKQMQQQIGITFVYVTHDQEEALTMSDRIAVLSDGQILQVGTPTAIYEAPNCRFVADFIGESNFLVGRVVEASASGLVVCIDEHLPIAIPQPLDLPVGKIVTLAIRPEKLIVQPEQPGTAAWLTGTVVESLYLGTDTRLTVRLTANSSLVARRQNVYRTSLDTFQIGDRVQLQVATESICVLPEGRLPRPSVTAAAETPPVAVSSSQEAGDVEDSRRFPPLQ